MACQVWPWRGASDTCSRLSARLQHVTHSLAGSSCHDSVISHQRYWDFFPNALVVYRLVCCSGLHCRTQLHRDVWDNLYCCVKGQRRWCRLFDSYGLTASVLRWRVAHCDHRWLERESQSVSACDNANDQAQSMISPADSVAVLFQEVRPSHCVSVI